MRVVHRIMELEGAESLDIDAHDVFEYDPDLYNKMVRYPLEVLAIFDIVLMDLVARIDPLFEKHIQTRIHNLKSSVCMRNINPSGKFQGLQLVSVKPSIINLKIRCGMLLYLEWDTIPNLDPLDLHHKSPILFGSGYH